MQSTQVCSAGRAALAGSRLPLRRSAAFRSASAPLRARLAVVRAAADQEPARAQEASAEATTTALLAAAGLLAPLLLDTESAQAVPDLIKGRTFSLIHPGECACIISMSGGVGWFQRPSATRLMRGPMPAPGHVLCFACTVSSPESRDGLLAEPVQNHITTTACNSCLFLVDTTLASISRHCPGPHAMALMQHWLAELCPPN